MAQGHHPCPGHPHERGAETDPTVVAVFPEAPFGRLLLGRLLMSVLGGVWGGENYTERARGRTEGLKGAASE